MFEIEFVDFQVRAKLTKHLLNAQENSLKADWGLALLRPSSFMDPFGQIPSN